MHELSTILERWREAGRDGVLATVVHVRGSAYRRPGARMLILEDGSRVGTISGGCLETDVVRKAWWWTDHGATIRTFDNTREDAARDFGLGCNGVITVLLERVETAGVGRLLEFLEVRQRRREAVVVATVIRAADAGELAVGDRVLCDAGGIVEGADLPIAGLLTAAVRATFAERRSRLVHLSDAEVFVEWVGPPQRLFVFGGGHDVVPLAALARMMGWSLTIADSRLSRVEPGRFPDAEKIFTVPSSGDISDLDIGHDDAVVVMTHNYPQDVALMPHILAANPRYLGLLGPRVRTEKMFAEIGADPLADNVHAPVGLDIGGDHPEGIALSIVAEIQSVLSGQPGGRLRRRKGAIHAPALELGVEAPAPTWNPDHSIQPTCAVWYA